MEVLDQVKEKVEAVAATENTDAVAAQDEETKNVQDYCQYIPTVTELGANAYQLIAQNQISSEMEQTAQAEGRSNNQQLGTLYAIKANQKQRRKAAVFQSSGWGAASACYITYMATRSMTSIKIDTKMVLKTAAAVTLTTFYGFKARAHKERAKAIQEVIDSLPRAGECNPVSATTCFCGEASSATSDPTNFAKYCIPKPFANKRSNNNNKQSNK